MADRSGPPTGRVRRTATPAAFLLRINAGLTSVLAGLEATIDWDRLGPEIWPESAV